MKRKGKMATVAARRPTPSKFDSRVYRLLRKIPKGKVATYGQIARLAGNPRAARAVGNALNKNPYAPGAPCHRVVQGSGSVGGYARGTARKTIMLRKEGIEIRAGRIHLGTFGWRPK